MSAVRADVLVIGLGPAGAAAAGAAARAGLSVLAIDRKREPGVPVQCAEFVPLPLAARARAPGVLAQPVAAMVSVLPSGARRVSDWGGLMVDRAAFDRALVREAEEAGARIELAATLCELDAESRSACVRGPAAGARVEFGVAIAADGPRSSSARLLGLAPLPTVRTRQYTVALRSARSATEVWLSAEYPGGYAWLFPKGARANLGLGADPRFRAELKGPLDALHRALAAAGAVGEEVLGATGGPIPVGGLRSRLAVGSVLFAGDAAGLAHPVTGAGIAPAVLSGERAAQAAAEFLGGRAAALADYEEEMREQFGPALARALARRRELDAAWGGAAARGDALHRRGWVAFEEYFAEEAA
jgi:geranylgeranyl reductase family protein